MLEKGLLTVRFADKETHQPIVPNGFFPIAIDDKPIELNAWVNDDGGTVSVWSLEAGTHNVAAIAPTGYKQPARLDGVVIDRARPTTAVIELEPAPDLVITKFTYGDCRRDGSRNVKITVKTQGKKKSPATTGRVLVSINDSVPSGDDFVALSFSIGELQPEEKIVISKPAMMPVLNGLVAVANFIAIIDALADESDESNNNSTILVESCK